MLLIWFCGVFILLGLAVFMLYANGRSNDTALPKHTKGNKHSRKDKANNNVGKKHQQANQGSKKKKSNNDSVAAVRVADKEEAKSVSFEGDGVDDDLESLQQLAQLAGIASDSSSKKKASGSSSLSSLDSPSPSASSPPKSSGKKKNKSKNKAADAAPADENDTTGFVCVKSRKKRGGAQQASSVDEDLQHATDELTRNLKQQPDADMSEAIRVAAAAEVSEGRGKKGEGSSKSGKQQKQQQKQTQKQQPKNDRQNNTKKGTNGQQQAEEVVDVSDDEWEIVGQKETRPSEQSALRSRLDRLEQALQDEKTKAAATARSLQSSKANETALARQVHALMSRLQQQSQQDSAPAAATVAPGSKEETQPSSAGALHAWSIPRTQADMSSVKVAESKGNLQDQLFRIKRLQKELAENDTARFKLHHATRLEVAEERVDEFSGVQASLEARIKDLGRNATKLEDEHANFVDEKNSLIADLERKLERAQSEASEQTEKANAMELELAPLKKKVEEQEATMAANKKRMQQLMSVMNAE
eukprot:TRINITY_DN5456_c0_g1_i1.p1 TRINITY_DN5456_c0_g1~~TRINITY_DN5456_c0_g1_i1.p1  ORF type:complete len:531 (+),score=200.62 TRINITY_DN5456_c0_g1_i1:415-2007(+)